MVQVPSIDFEKKKCITGTVENLYISLTGFLKGISEVLQWQ